jgi:hypothetical protein
MPIIWPPPGPRQGPWVSNTTIERRHTNTDAVSMKDLQSEAFNTSVETLIDLWLTRYGNEWVDMEKIEGDEFYVLAYKRLKSLGQLETHYLTDRARFVCRKPT